jgi:hypothetical protein
VPDDLLPVMLPDMPLTVEQESERCCDHLAARINGLTGRTPRVTASWRRDMRLLITNGPVGYIGNPETPESIHAVIDGTFDHHTWWADKITGPNFLRKHYVRISSAIPMKRSGDVTAMIDQLRSL